MLKMNQEQDPIQQYVQKKPETVPSDPCGPGASIYSSFTEQGEPTMKKQRGQRANELGELFADRDKLQQPPKANFADITERKEDENATVQLEDDSVDQNRAAEVEYPSISNAFFRFAVGFVYDPEYCEYYCFRSNRIIKFLKISMYENDGSVVQVQGVGTSLKVTIQRSSESRAFSTTHEETPASHDGEKEKHKLAAKFTCYVCNFPCPDQQVFQTHMTSLDHQQRMMDIQQASNTRLAALLPQTRESLQGTNRERKIDRQRWCPNCQCHFSGDIIEHRRTTKHKLAKISSRPFCTLCERHFRTPRKFVEHMKSPEHKLKVEELKNEGDPEVMEELITVDAVGCFEGEDDYEEDRNEEVVPVFEKHPVHKDIVPEEASVYKVYDPDTQYGTSFVVPVAGFLCNLCHKFYHFESSARETHCRSLIHFQNLQKYNALKMQKKSHEDSESDVSCSSPMMDRKEHELSAGCSNETEISDIAQSDLSTSHIHPSRKRKLSKRRYRFRTLYSKTSSAPQNSTVVMKHLLCTSRFGSGSNRVTCNQECKKS